MVMNRRHWKNCMPQVRRSSQESLMRSPCSQFAPAFGLAPIPRLAQPAYWAFQHIVACDDLTPEALDRQSGENIIEIVVSMDS